MDAQILDCSLTLTVMVTHGPTRVLFQHVRTVQRRMLKYVINL